MKARARRALLTFVLLGSCKRAEPTTHAHDPPAAPNAGPTEPRTAAPTRPDEPREETVLTMLQFERVPGGSTHVAVVSPRAGGPYPVVFALHGRGEALKPPAEGALGFPRDYALQQKASRLYHPPLTPEDFESFVPGTRLRTHNERLAVAPYGGLVVVCPHLPDLDLRDGTEAKAFGRYLLSTVLPRVLREFAAMPDRVGIDGVSLGGATALHIGLSFPKSFLSVGALQPAIRSEDAPMWTERVIRARKENPGLVLRLATSDEDGFRSAVEALSTSLRTEKVTHEFVRGPGPHDYAWNRGPGSLELLLFHDAALRRR